MFNDNVDERYELGIERIKEIAEAPEMKSEGYVSYFKCVAAFILKMDKLVMDLKAGVFENYSLEELSEHNRSLYEDVIGDAYEKSFANPAYAAGKLGLSEGRLLSFLYVEIRGMIVYAYENRMAEMTALMELFIEVYCVCISTEEDNGRPDYRQMREAVYWYVSDYSDDHMEYRVRELLDPELDFATRIIMDSDLDDVRYLYRFGEYITDNELKTARYLNSLGEDEIQRMADTFTEGYRIGFELTGKDLSKKKTVNIRYCLGFERLVKAEINNFAKLGLRPTIYRAAVNTINKRLNIKVGYYGANPNRQMDFDHRFDNALYMDGEFVERKTGALRLAYEKNKELAAVHGGPAVMEVFGETPFEPEAKSEALTLDAKQQKLSVKYNNDSGSIVNEYIKGEERSFTIIAYPVPDIGDNFEEIFQGTVRINTLDYNKYKAIQQALIDVLDTAEYVEVKGKGGNCTDMRVSIMKVTDHRTQTVFENCLADVNIPLGEVFTSPVLAGTTGVLNVSSVYLNDIKFNNLKVWFKDGMASDYSCDNFDDEEKNKALFKSNVLYDHDTLPIGEFAIGTNTTAYVFANKHDIVYKLPILIVEKMGPHFALGDTCYSRAEDVYVTNPDGKEIISRDNEVSLKRKTEPEKAYYNCHTDITIPYDEIGRISVVAEDGTSTDIIRDGRFVLPGTEELNEAFSDEKN
ncbi:MAG: aminopeptidase [Clostridia bacterium]|nr:aminopeptidase [Clostridia bacterium]